MALSYKHHAVHRTETCCLMNERWTDIGLAERWSTQREERWVQNVAWWNQYKSRAFARRPGLLFSYAVLDTGNYSGRGKGNDIYQSLVFFLLIVSSIHSSTLSTWPLCPRYCTWVGEMESMWNDPKSHVANSTGPDGLQPWHKLSWLHLAYTSAEIWMMGSRALPQFGEEKELLETAGGREWLGLCSSPWFPNQSNPICFQTIPKILLKNSLHVRLSFIIYTHTLIPCHFSWILYRR